MPSVAREIFETRDAFTIAKVNGLKDWKRRRDETFKREVAEFPKNPISHPEAALTIETCCAFIIVDGELPDPRTKDLMPTSVGSADKKYFELRTSRPSLRMGDTRPLNVIRIRNQRNVVNNWSIAGLHYRAELAFILGLLQVSDLRGDRLVGADRMGLTDTPLVRTLRHWVSQQVEVLANQIQQANAKEHKPEECISGKVAIF